MVSLCRLIRSCFFRWPPCPWHNTILNISQIAFNKRHTITIRSKIDTPLLARVLKVIFGESPVVPFRRGNHATRRQGNGIQE